MPAGSVFTRTPDTLHLLLDNPQTAEVNMAVDEALFDLACGRGLAVLRLYGWSRPSLTVGRFQEINRHFDHEKIVKDRLPLVRRMTGGRGVLHHDELTYCFAMSSSLLDPFTKQSVFVFINGLFRAAFRRLGIESGLKGRTGGREHASGDCFRSVSEYEVATVEGLKLAGSAQYIGTGGVIQQGTIPLRTPGILTIDRYLRETAGSSVPAGDDAPSAGPVGAALDRAALTAAIVAELAPVFRNVLTNSIRPEPGLVSRLIRDRYANPDWNLRIGQPEGTGAK